MAPRVGETGATKIIPLHAPAHAQIVFRTEPSEIPFENDLSFNKLFQTLQYEMKEILCTDFSPVALSIHIRHILENEIQFCNKF